MLLLSHSAQQSVDETGDKKIVFNRKDTLNDFLLNGPWYEIVYKLTESTKFACWNNGWFIVSGAKSGSNCAQGGFTGMGHAVEARRSE
jgi:hypothetical protein